MIHSVGNVECFELCDISSQISSVHTVKSIGQKASSTCGNQACPDALTIPNFVIKKGTRRGARHGKTEAQGEYRQAKDCVRKALKNNHDSILQRFQQIETNKESQQAIGRDEDTCRCLDKIAREDHSYIATWVERPDAVRTIRDLRQKDDQKTDLSILPSQQIR